MVSWQKSIEWQKQEESVRFSDKTIRFSSSDWLSQQTNLKNRPSELPMERVKAADEEKDVEGEAEDDNQWFKQYESYLFICIFFNFYDKEKSC